MISLAGVVQELSLARDLQAIMNVVRGAARELTGADGATFVLRAGDRCYYAEEQAIGPLWKGQSFPMEACASGWAMQNRAAEVIEDIYDHPHLPLDVYRPTFVKSLCMVPIRTKAPIGAIGAYWASRHQATARELELLQALADSTSVAMENVEVHAELEARVQERTRELEDKSRTLAAQHEALLELLRQKEALSALVMHDLRSPATAIMMAASLQLRSHGLEPGEQRRWSSVFSSAEHILRTAGNLLDIAHSKEGKLVPKPCEIESCAVLDEIRELLLPLAEKRRQAIEIACAEPRVVLRADRELLGRVLQNLVDNALHHSPSSSAVRLEARADDAAATIAVCDEGPGIPVEVRDRVFDWYVRLEHGAGETRAIGWGLGLAFCRMAIEAHGGSIWIEDNAPRGSRFCFRLPRGAA